MASDSHVSSRSPKAFGSYRLGTGTANVAAVANAVVAIPILDGGLTNSGNAATSGSFIPRRVTVVNPSVGLTTTSISIGKTNDGANLVCNAQALSNIGATNSWQDLLLNGTGVGNVAIDGTVCQALFVNVTANAVTNGTCQVIVYGDVLNA
jgi:hypothetical protein